MRALTYTLLFVTFAAALAVPVPQEVAEATREKRSPGGWHSKPEGVWKNKLVWKEEWKQIWKTEKKLAWKTVEVPAWRKVWKPVWQKEWVQIHHEHHGWDK